MIYDTTGKIKITSVDGSALTGLYASDGSVNAVIDDSTHTGSQHPCGALRVNSGTGSTVYDTSGAYYINKLLGSPQGGVTVP